MESAKVEEPDCGATGTLLPSKTSSSTKKEDDHQEYDHDEERHSRSSKDSHPVSNTSSGTSSTRFQKFILTFTGCLEGFFYK
jgi:hypothetical protein